MITNDFLLQQKAGSHGHAWRAAEEMLTVQELSSPEEATIRKLEQEIQILRTRVPKLSFGFLEGDEIVHHVIRTSGTVPELRVTNAAIELAVSEKRLKFEQIVADAPERTLQFDVKKYIDHYNEYLDEQQKYLTRKRAKTQDWRVEFAFHLSNNGNTVAQDVDICIAFPSEAFAVARADEGGEDFGFGDLQEPLEPIAEWKRKYDYLHGIVPNFSQIVYPSSVIREPEPRGPLYGDSDRSIVRYKHPKIWPKTPWLLNPIVVYVPSSIRGGFPIDVTVNADELPEPNRSTLNVQLIHESE